MKKTVLIMFIITIMTVLLLAPFASGNPDGLERVAMDNGFDRAAEGKAIISTPFNDYTASFIRNEKISTAFSGLLGISIVLVLSFILGKILKTKNP